MLNFRIGLANGLWQHRNVGLMSAVFLALALSVPPAFAADADQAPAATEEATAPSQNPQTTNREAPPAALQSPPSTPESPPAKQESSPDPGDSAPGAATGSKPVEQTAGKGPSLPSEPRRFHRAQMRLSGSTCLACLMGLERKLKEVPGIAKVKIQRADQTHFEFQGAPGITYSEATITYDTGQVTLSEIVDFMRNHGYRAYKIVDKDKG